MAFWNRFRRWELNLDESDDDEAEQKPNLRKELRDSSDPFSMGEKEFQKMFRLSRCAARQLLDEIGEEHERRRYSHAIPFHLRFLAALNFFGHGSYQKPTAENRIYCQSQASMSRSLSLVLDVLLPLCEKYIKFPTTPEELMNAKIDFMSKFAMPGIIGAIDGTHISIVQPPENEDGYQYYNRKHFYSINVLAACNAKKMFTYADAAYPGSVHDSAIWQMGQLKHIVNQNGSAFLLGDSGFPEARILLTPVLNAVAGSKEAIFNAAHKKTRNVIEQTFGMFKSRFRCMHKHRTLYYGPKKAGKIVYACMILHNICVLRSIPMDNDNDDANDEEPDDNHVFLPIRGEAGDGRRARQQYINRYF